MSIMIFRDVLGRPINPARGLVLHGGPGSGDFGHAGRPGEVGGSSSDGGGGEAAHGEHGGHGEEAHMGLGHDLHQEYKETEHIVGLSKGHAEAAGGLVGGVIGEKLDHALGGNKIRDHFLGKMEKEFGHATPYLLAGVNVAAWAAKRYFAGQIGEAVGHALGHVLGEHLGETGAHLAATAGHHAAKEAAESAAETVGEHLRGEAHGELAEKLHEKVSEILGDAAGNALPFIGAAGVITAYYAGKMMQVHHLRQTALAQKLGMAHEVAARSKAVAAVTKGLQTYRHYREKYISKLIDRAIDRGIGAVKGAARLVGKGLKKAAGFGVEDLGAAADLKHNVLGPYAISLMEMIHNAAPEEGAPDLKKLHEQSTAAYLELFGEILQAMKDSPEFATMLNDPQSRQQALAMTRAWLNTGGGNG